MYRYTREEENIMSDKNTEKKGSRLADDSTFVPIVVSTPGETTKSGVKSKNK